MGEIWVDVKVNKAEISKRYYRVDLEQYVTQKRTIIDD